MHFLEVSVHSTILNQDQEFRGVSFGSLLPQSQVDLLLDPILVDGNIHVCSWLKDETAKISQVVDELKEFADVVCDGGAVGVQPLQVLLKDSADSFHTFSDRIIICVRPCVCNLSRLNQQNCVRHSDNLLS